MPALKVCIRRALLGLAISAGPLYAQALESSGSAVGGVQARGYSFERGFPLDAVRQVALPVAVTVPIGRRFSLDVGTSYATTTVRDTLGGSTDFSGLTDTQIRGSYVFGSDAVVTTVMVNLPTGTETTTLEQFNVASSVSSNFLLFPVNAYGTATSVTGGVAAARPVGSWNLGLAASVRVSSEYRPFKNAGGADSVRYKPGVESRVRAGADRLIGSSRLTLGFTFSTFSNDEFRGPTGAYNPGNRYIGEASLTSAVGNGSLSMYVWNYYRESAGGSAGLPGARENVFTMGTRASVPMGARVGLQPFAEARIWSPDQGAGHLIGFGSSIRFELGSGLAFIPGGRVDLGSMRGAGFESRSVTGWGANGLLQYSF